MAGLARISDDGDTRRQHPRLLRPAPPDLDGRPSLLLDYRGTSLVYGRHRDEIREVAPGLYLGVMFARTRPWPTSMRLFAFEARP